MRPIKGDPPRSPPDRVYHAARRSVTSDARQGTNDFHRLGWGGPCPPRGPAHRYVFRLYALDAETNLARGATPAAFAKTIGGHVLGRAALTGRYARR